MLIFKRIEGSCGLKSTQFDLLYHKTNILYRQKNKIKQTCKIKRLNRFKINRTFLWSQASSF